MKRWAVRERAGKLRYLAWDNSYTVRMVNVAHYATNHEAMAMCDIACEEPVPVDVTVKEWKP